MNAVEIEAAISELALQPFDAEEFPFAFLAAFGNKDTTLKRLRTGNNNASDVPGGHHQSQGQSHPRHRRADAGGRRVGKWWHTGRNHSLRLPGFPRPLRLLPAADTDRIEALVCLDKCSKNQESARIPIALEHCHDHY